MERKRILFLSSWYPSKENENLGNFVQRHAEVAKGVADITVLYAVSTGQVRDITFARENIDGVDTLYVYYPKTRIGIPFFKNLVKKRRYINALKKGYEYLDDTFELVHLNVVFPAGIFARYLKRRIGIPYILTVHWTGYLDHTRTYMKLPFYLKKKHQRIFRDAEKVFPVSEHLGKSLIKLGLIREFEVLPNVVNEAFFYPKKDDVNELDRPIRFIHVSSFDDSHKNITGMLTAFKAFQDRGNDFTLHLITEGNESRVWKMIERIGLNPEKIKVESKLSPEKVGAALRSADCFVLFSNYETFSVVLAEAWVSGIPAIYSKCGGLTEIKNDILGVQIERKNIEQFLRALSAFDRNCYECERIANSVSNFRSSEIEIQLAEIYSNF